VAFVKANVGWIKNHYRFFHPRSFLCSFHSPCQEVQFLNWPQKLTSFQTGFLFLNVSESRASESWC